MTPLLSDLREWLPLTLTLPGSSHWSRPVLRTPVKTGRVDVSYERLVGNGEVATRPLRPARAGRRCRQADEGQASAISQEPASKTSQERGADGI
ncbi:hypothetical protein C3Y91_14255 [Rhizobium sp. UPM1133]|nr:hypothetical protein [Rhizobium ruizarguesonis]